jgi:hypothetical protein
MEQDSLDIFGAVIMRPLFLLRFADIFIAFIALLKPEGVVKTSQQNTLECSTSMPFQRE